MVSPVGVEPTRPRGPRFSAWYVCHSVTVTLVSTEGVEPSSPSGTVSETAASAIPPRGHGTGPGDRTLRGRCVGPVRSPARSSRVGLGGGIRTPNRRHPKPELYQVEPHPDNSADRGLGGGIRTPDPRLPRPVLYRVEPHPERQWSRRRESNPHGQPYEGRRPDREPPRRPCQESNLDRQASEACVWCRQNRGMASLRGVEPRQPASLTGAWAPRTGR